MNADVTELIVALQNGSMTLEEVADRFRGRSWPRRNTEKAATYLDLAAAAERDPDPYLIGIFDDMAAAFIGVNSPTFSMRRSLRRWPSQCPRRRAQGIR